MELAQHALLRPSARLLISNPLLPNRLSQAVAVHMMQVWGGQERLFSDGHEIPEGPASTTGNLPDLTDAIHHLYSPGLVFHYGGFGVVKRVRTGSDGIGKLFDGLNLMPVREKGNISTEIRLVRVLFSGGLIFTYCKGYCIFHPVSSMLTQFFP